MDRRAGRILMARRWLETWALLAGMLFLIAFPVAILAGVGWISVAFLVASAISFCLARIWRWEPGNGALHGKGRTADNPRGCTSSS
jgi:hypothetical protein